MIKIIFFLCFTAILQAQDFNKPKLDSLLDLLEENDKVMGGLSIMHDGKEVYQKSIGFADVPEKSTADFETKYRMGFYNKNLYGNASHAICRRGKIKFDRYVEHVFSRSAKCK